MKESPTAQGGLVEIQCAQADPRWNLAQRIASSETFSTSARLPRFLLYVCECALSGREHEVNEQQIGVHVFGRAPGYNSNEDSVVRSQARLLRTRLDAYFQNEGCEEPLIVRIPKGSYVPKFEPREVLTVTTTAAAVPARSIDTRRNWSPGWVVAAALAVTLAIAAWLGYSRMHQSPSAGFWAQMFPANRPTLFVPDDTTLVLVQNFTHQHVDLKAYLNRSYLRDTGTFPTSAESHRYTNITDLNFFSRLSRVPAFNAEHTFIRYARDLQMADLRGSNLMIIGARRANPWVELFDQKNNFQGLQSEELGDFIRNRAPRDQEQPLYRFGEPGADHTYGLISFVPGITGDESVLLLGGLDTAGTEGTANFLFSGGFEDFLTTRVGGGRGRLRHFEILLRMGRLNGSAQRTEVVAYRLHDD